jgi:peptidoglycan hydrolase CwlO-like protein
MAFANNQGITSSIGNRSVLTPPTQQMINDYKKSLITPFIDEKGEARLYRTVTPVVLDNVEDQKRELERKENKIKETLGSERQKIKEDLEKIDNDINKINDILDKKRVHADKPLFEFASQIAHFDKMNNDYKVELKNINKSIILIEKEQKKNNSNIVANESLLKKNNEEIININEELRKIAPDLTDKKLAYDNAKVKLYAPSTTLTESSEFNKSIIEYEALESEYDKRRVKLNELNKKGNIFEKNISSLTERNEDLEKNISSLTERNEDLEKGKETLELTIAENKKNLTPIYGINMAGVKDLVSDRSKLQIVRENAFDAFIAKQAEYEKDMADFDNERRDIQIATEKNKDLVQKYNTNFKELNQGLTNIPVQNPGELEEEYYQRLTAYTGTKYDDTDLKMALEYKIGVELKDKFNDLFDMQNPNFLSIVEGVLNDSDMDLSNKKQLLSKWELFKDTYLKTYGKNNKIIKASQILDLWKNLSTTTNPSASLASFTATAPAQPIETQYPTTRVFNYDDDFKSNHKIYYVFAKISNKVVMGISTTDVIGSFVKVDPFSTPKNLIDTGLFNSINIDENNLIAVLEDFLLEVKNLSRSVGKGLLYYLEPLLSDSVKNRLTRNQYLKRGTVDGHKDRIIGFGIKMPEVEKFANFGKVVIMLDKLIKTNTLVIKDKRGASILGVRNILVSDHMVNIITKLIADLKADISSDYIELSPADLEIYSALMELSGLHKILKVPKPNIKVYKDKLKVIVGEIEAGNDNLISDLQDCLNKLVALKAITKTEAKRYFNDLTQ